MAGGNPALPLAAPEACPRARPCLCPARSLTGPASALLAGKSLKTLMSKGSCRCILDLRLSRLSNILPSGEMWEKTWGFRVLFLLCGAWPMFSRISPSLNSARGQEGAPRGK